MNIILVAINLLQSMIFPWTDTEIGHTVDRKSGPRQSRIQHVFLYEHMWRQEISTLKSGCAWVLDDGQNLKAMPRIPTF